MCRGKRKELTALDFVRLIEIMLLMEPNRCGWQMSGKFFIHFIFFANREKKTFLFAIHLFSWKVYCEIILEDDVMCLNYGKCIHNIFLHSITCKLCTEIWLKHRWPTLSSFKFFFFIPPKLIILTQGISPRI